MKKKFVNILSFYILLLFYHCIQTGYQITFSFPFVIFIVLVFTLTPCNYINTHYKTLLVRATSVHYVLRVYIDIYKPTDYSI